MMVKQTLFSLITVSTLLAACSPGLLPIEGTAGISTPIVGTAVPDTSTSLPDDFTPPPPPIFEPPTPIPTLPSGLTPTELKYELLSRYPDMFYCDPDFFPVASGDEAERAMEAFPALQANPEEFQAILKHNDLEGLTTFTNEQVLLVYQEHKRLGGISLQLADGDGYQFQLQDSEGEGQGSVINGLIDGSGAVTILASQPSIPTCPICLAEGTRIDTPEGPVAVEILRTGDYVWTVTPNGERIPARVLLSSHTDVPPGHEVVHALLEDGRELWVSPGHPTADGRTFGELRLGDMLDGSHLVGIERAPYAGQATYDILPEGGTGWYWANGVLVGSTLGMEVP